MLSTSVCRALLPGLILCAPLAHASTVVFTFDSLTSAAGTLVPDLDPSGTGFTATFGSNAPPNTFGIISGNASILSFFPDAKIISKSLGETNPYGQDHPLVIQSNIPFTAIRLDWVHFSVPAGGYLEISDGLGKTQIYHDDGSVTATMDGNVVGNVAGSAFFETSAPVTSITITGWDTHDSPPGSPMVQAIGIDNVEFTVVPEPAAALLSCLGTLILLRRKRRTD